MTMKTFRDLSNFIQTAERDSSGYHILNERWSLHIYNNLHQVNVNCKFNGVNESVANFIFDEDDVTIVSVDNGRADYDNPISINIDTPIDVDRNNVQRWNRHLGNLAGQVKEVLRDM